MHRICRTAFLLVAATCVLPLTVTQAQTTPAAPTRLVGSLVGVDGQKITVKDQQGVQTTVAVTDTTKFLQIAPGQTSLAGAMPIKITDIAPGDRLLVRLQPSPDGNGMVAGTVVAMKQADIAQQHAAVLEAWQHGVGGLVKQVDAADRSIVITTNGIAHPKSVTIKLGPSAVVKRYAAESVQYEQAQPSSLDKIMVGDQLRARGAAGSEPANFQADEVVAGSFRSISGKITSIDNAAGMVTLTDLATKQPVQLKVTADSQLRKLDDATADRLAAAMKAADAGASGGARPSGGPPSGGAPSGSPPAGAAPAGGGGPTSRRSGGQGGGSSAGGDMQQALAHAAPIHLADLKKGDIVMAVASSGADTQLGAVTVVTGVDPLLRASPSASAAVLSSWSLGGNAAGGGEQQ